MNGIIIIWVVTIALAILINLAFWLKDYISYRRFKKHWSKAPEGYENWTEEQRREFMDKGNSYL